MNSELDKALRASSREAFEAWFVDEVSRIEAGLAPGTSSSMHRAKEMLLQGWLARGNRMHLITTSSPEALRGGEVGLPGVLAEAFVLQLAYSSSSAGRLDSSAPAHLPTFAISDLLRQLSEDVGQQEEAWEAIRTYADMRAAGALMSLIPLLRGAALEAAKQQVDAGLMRAIDRYRIELLPEYDAGYTARAYACNEQPVSQVVALTAREALEELVHQLQPAEPEAGA